MQALPTLLIRRHLCYGLLNVACTKLEKKEALVQGMDFQAECKEKFYTNHL